jgi:hypothetical protein
MTAARLLRSTKKSGDRHPNRVVAFTKPPEHDSSGLATFPHPVDPHGQHGNPQLSYCLAEVFRSLPSFSRTDFHIELPFIGCST